MFLVKSRSDVQFGFEYPFFCVPDHASKIAHLKNRAPKKRFAHKDVELLFIRMCFAYIAHEINIGLLCNRYFYLNKLMLWESIEATFLESFPIILVLYEKDLFRK